MLESLFSPGWYGRYQGWAVFHTMPFADKAYRDTKHGDPDGVNHGADEEVTRHVTCCRETRWTTGHNCDDDQHERAHEN